MVNRRVRVRTPGRRRVQMHKTTVIVLASWIVDLFPGKEITRKCNSVEWEGGPGINRRRRSFPDPNAARPMVAVIIDINGPGLFVPRKRFGDGKGAVGDVLRKI